MSSGWRYLVFTFGVFGWFPQQTGAQSTTAVRQIEITSSWSGLAAAGKTDVLISKVGPAYYRNDQSIPADLVVALVKALKAPPNPGPRLEDLGITPAWLKANASSAAEKEKGASMNGQPVHVADLEALFADPVAMEPVALGLFKNRHTDDYPSVKVVVTFEDGTILSASSHSQFAFLLPWNLGNDGSSVIAYNADISRAAAALMPENAKNRSRLAGESLVGLLAQAAVFQIEHKYQLLAVEDKTGNTFSQLRTKYSILSADIRQPSPQVTEASQEAGLHLSLKATDLPPNLTEEVILGYVNGSVVGTEEFLRAVEQIEKRVLSVPWLNRYIRENPKVAFRLWYVHDSSFSEKDMALFSTDMHSLGREKLIPEVERAKSQIALLSVGNFTSDWLIFPDGHALLWRYYDFSSMAVLQPVYSGGKATIFDWSVSEFPTKPCSDNQRYRRCVGRAVSSSGKLLPLE